jgi:hypothetical protein
LKAYTLTSTDTRLPAKESLVNTPLRIRAAAFSAAIVLSLVMAEAVALIGLPPESAEALVVALASLPR